MFKLIKYNPNMPLDKAVKIYVGCYVALAVAISATGGLMLFTDPNDLQSKVLISFCVALATYLLFMDTGHRKSLFKHAAEKRANGGLFYRIVLFKPLIQTVTYFLSVMLPMATCFTVLGDRMTMQPIHPLEFALSVLAISAMFSCVIFALCLVSLIADVAFKKIGKKMRERIDGF